MVHATVTYMPTERQLTVHGLPYEDAGRVQPSGMSPSSLMI